MALCVYLSKVLDSSLFFYLPLVTASTIGSSSKTDPKSNQFSPTPGLPANQHDSWNPESRYLEGNTTIPQPHKKKQTNKTLFVPKFPFSTLFSHLPTFLKTVITYVSSLNQNVTISSPYLEKGSHSSVLNLLRIKSKKKKMYKYMNVHKHFLSSKTAFWKKKKNFSVIMLEDFFSPMTVRNLSAGGKIYLQAMLKHSDLLKHSLPWLEKKITDFKEPKAWAFELHECTI